MPLMNTKSDEVILDLEDAVAPNEEGGCPRPSRELAQLRSAGMGPDQRRFANSVCGLSGVG